jgi:glycosyltransferase involved in cell wall biosynthesis
LVITNSELTKGQVERCLEGKPVPVQTVYLGGEAGWGPISDDERKTARKALGIAETRKIACFVGALSTDNRKGFDILFEAWKQLCTDPNWDADLIVAGTGNALPIWKSRIGEAGLTKRIQMLGFRKDIPALLAASDILVSPTRFEPYGLNLQEALCRELPVMTTIQAGIAERFPEEMKDLVIHDTENVSVWVERLKLWRSKPDSWHSACAQLGTSFRQRGWPQMAQEMVELIER